MLDWARSIPLCVFLLCLSGCGSDPKLDATSDESLKESIANAKASLTAEEKKQFEEALRVVAFADVDNIFELAADPDSITRKLKDKVDGSTAREIIAEAKKIKADRRARQREQIVGEIEELEKAKRQAAADETQLKHFAVQRSRFYFKKNDFLSRPVIELTVTNNTRHAVSRAFFHGVLATPSRSIPWVEDDFNYSISGGLEPGESATWELAPNSFSSWGNAPKDRDDMVLTVKVVRIDGANDEAIFDAEFSDSDQDRLTRLSKQLAEFDRKED